MFGKKYKSDAFEATHESVSGLHKIGLVSEDDKQYFDSACLGESFDDFLKEEGIFEEVEKEAKRKLAELQRKNDPEANPD